jgi:hypothetical protein
MTGYVYIVSQYGLMPGFVRIGYTTTDPGDNIYLSWKQASIYHHHERIVAVYKTKEYLTLFNAMDITYNHNNDLGYGHYRITPGQAVKVMDSLIERLDIKAEKIKSLEFAHLFAIYRDKKINFFCTEKAPFEEPLLHAEIEIIPGDTRSILPDIMEAINEHCSIHPEFFQGSKINLGEINFDTAVSLLKNFPGLVVDEDVYLKDYIYASLDINGYLSTVSMDEIYKKHPEDFEHFKKHLIDYVKNNKFITWQYTKDSIIRKLKENWK